MNDLFLERKETNHGCLIGGVVALVVVLFLVWFFFFRSGPEEKPEADQSGLQNKPAEPSQPRAAGGGGASRTSTSPANEPAPSPLFAATIKEAQTLVTAHDPSMARQKGFEALALAVRSDERLAAETFLGDLHIKLIFTPMPMEEKVEYTIRSGDMLVSLAKRHGTTVDLIRRGNNLSGSLIRVGDRLRILQGKFSIRVSKSDNDLLVNLNDRFFKRYRVGTGQFNRTPVGMFKITDKIAEPPWWRPDGKLIPYGNPENLLGTRWLSLDVRGYGIHGTWEPETIGQQLSAGCVRMRNEEVEELFDYIPLQTPVEIVD